MPDDDNEIYSKAGILSKQIYNIINSFEKLKQKKNLKHFDSYYIDKEYNKNIKGKTNNNDLMSGVNFNIDKLKKDIKKYNMYLKIEEEKKNKNKKKEMKNNNNKYYDISTDKIEKEILNKKLLFRDKRYYKYYNEHMKRVNKYKSEGLYKTVFKHKETLYVPKLEYIYKKVLTGPKWEKLSSRDLFNLEKKSRNDIQEKKINNSVENKNSDINKKIKEKNKSRNNTTLIPKKIKYTKFSKINNTDLTNKISTKMNENTNYTSNKYFKSFLDTKSNNKLKLSYDFKKNSILNSKKNSYNNLKKFLKKKPNSILLNRNNYNKTKKEHLRGPDFNHYLDLEKVERKKKRLQRVPLGKMELIPNYSSIEGHIRSFVNYQQKNSESIKKPAPIFKGISSYEFLYDAGKTFDNIYGIRMKAVPEFIKMKERPSDINLPTYMKGFYSRLGLELPGEKSLKMNNYENGKMYKSRTILGFQKKYQTLRNIYYEDDIEKNIDKIDRDLDVMKNKFKNIKYIDYN